MVSRERALNQIVSLKRLAEDQTTTEAERQAARDTMAKLRKKYDIPETTPPRQTQQPRTGTHGEDWSTWWLRTQETERVRNERIQERRAQAQRDWESRMQFRDAMGNPLTAEERAEAQRDPFGWAAKQDKRTHAQKQQDMNDSMGHQGRSQGTIRVCAPKLTFFDVGGEPRVRNTETMTCVMCGCRLIRGEGALYLRGYACCDTVPGPRNKKRGAD